MCMWFAMILGKFLQGIMAIKAIMAFLPNVACYASLCFSSTRFNTPSNAIVPNQVATITQRPLSPVSCIAYFLSPTAFSPLAFSPTAFSSFTFSHLRPFFQYASIFSRFLPFVSGTRNQQKMNAPTASIA